MEFTRRQLDAIDITRLGEDMCVVAGPGSGKTTVLVERFRRLVLDAGIAPLRILAITFTEKAATNMKQKLAAAFRDRPEVRREIERAYVSTVHGFCMRLLRENAIFAGIDPEFRVLDERQAATMQTLAVNDALDAMLDEDPVATRRLMAGISGSGLGGAIVEAYDAMRASGLAAPASPAIAAVGFDDLIATALELRGQRPRDWKPQQLAALTEVVAWGERHSALRGMPASAPHFQALEDFDCNLSKLKKGDPLRERVSTLKNSMEEAYRRLLTEYYAPERATLADVLRRFDCLYRERKSAAAVLDYADLEEATVRLLEENAGVRARVRGQFDQVLMDEFQDTNGLQKKLVELVRPADRFYAVGDINQSIYGFRHAEPRVFREYRDEVERSGKPLAELTENWRSRAEILQAVTTILADADGIEERALVAARAFMEKAEPSVEVLAAVADDAERALELEAKWVARRILELEGTLDLGNRTAGFGDIAVLMRNSEVMTAFAQAFDDAGIPYLVGRGRGFYDAQEITDLVHMLRVLANPRDEISMAAVLRGPLVGISDDALLRLKQAGNLGRLEAVGLAPADEQRIARFRAHLTDWRAARDYTAFDRLLLRAMDAAGYAHAPGTRAAANVEKFLAIARESAGRLTLAQFVDELELVRKADPRDADAPPEDSANAVRMLTVHAAKGLEFPVVFLAAIHKGMDAGIGEVSFSPRWGLGARWRNPVTGDDKDDLYQHAIREEKKKREAEEGNRLFYVAMTRAEQHLTLSYSRTAATLKHWAARVDEKLRIDLAAPGDARVEHIRTPDGGEFRVLARCVAQPPERFWREQAEVEREPVVRLERPVLDGQYDSNATVTSVALFAGCPQRYYLERYLGWERSASTPPSVTIAAGLSASDLGLQVHALLAGQQVDSPAPEALRLVKQFESSTLGKRAARATRAEREFDFLLAVEDVVLRGQIDLWFEDRGELILVDYKTDTIGSARELEEHAESYGEQLRLYALALERAAGRLPDRAYISFLRANETAPVDLSPIALHATRTLVREYRDAQETLTFPLRAGERCRRCPFYHDPCPAEMVSLSTCDAQLSSSASLPSSA